MVTGLGGHLQRVAAVAGGRRGGAGRRRAQGTGVRTDVGHGGTRGSAVPQRLLDHIQRDTASRVQQQGHQQGSRLQAPDPGRLPAHPHATPYAKPFGHGSPPLPARTHGRALLLWSL
ncbi:hypothetical protein GCM10010260_08280 [Streptomyces filipinensis]|uniref:Uncharacterized protein n=1 Tax=Streptomyces filipinensis TaxID=66887 RepID=A0A918I6F3_9ACTN|nr:hypothetical protein GCM10010260_08280 [Streptomyces filipinensis]